MTMSSSFIKNHGIFIEIMFYNYMSILRHGICGCTLHEDTITTLDGVVEALDAAVFFLDRRCS